jgi:hypothetical protein
MHKSMLLTFFIISVIAFAIISGSYFIIKLINLNDKVEYVIINFWTIISTLIISTTFFMEIILIFRLLMVDLGKGNVHYTIFTPQSIFSWFLPKLLIITIMQGLFAIFKFSHSYLVFDAVTNTNPIMLSFGLKEHLITLITSIFNYGLFGLISLFFALYYSFRKRGRAWLLILLSLAVYGISYGIFTIIVLFNKVEQQLSETTIDINLAEITLTEFYFHSIFGLIFMIIALYLYNKKVEY